MKALNAIVAAALAAAAGAPLAQTDERASTPPGVSRDGARPAEGAIQGGAILPGESGGLPDTAPGAASSADRAAARCYELRGTLREQCLRDTRAAGAGATQAPEAAPNVRDPATDPPPQRPR